MQTFLLVLLCFVAFIGGIIIIARVTPRLLPYRFDEGYFMALAALDILGAILAFGAVAILFFAFNGSLPIRILDFFLSLAILGIGVRTLMSSYRARRLARVIQSTRIMTAVFSLFLILAALVYIVQLFTTK